MTYDVLKAPLSSMKSKMQASRAKKKIPQRTPVQMRQGMRKARTKMKAVKGKSMQAALAAAENVGAAEGDIKAMSRLRGT